MSPSTARTDPRLVRAALEYAETHGPVITARKFNIDHCSVYRWRTYRAQFGAAWPTDQDIAEWDAKAEARALNAARKRRYEARVYLNRGPILVDATGSIRRLQALCRIGWTMAEIGAQPELNVTAERISQFVRGRHRTLQPDTVKAVTAVYDRLTSRQTALPTGPYATLARRIAEKKGWASPLAWDDDAIDDPDARPCGLISNTFDAAGYDESRVQRRIAGDRTIRLHKGESVEVVRRMLAEGLTQNEIRRRTGLKPDRYLDQIRAAQQPEQEAAA